MIMGTMKTHASMVAAIVLCLSVASTYAHAQDRGVVRGVVTDAKSDTPLRGAQLIIESTGISAISDQGGRYVLTGVPPGNHVLLARRIGYVSRQIKGVVVKPPSPSGESYGATVVNVQMFAVRQSESRTTQPQNTNDACGTTPWAKLASSDELLHEDSLVPGIVVPKDAVARRFENQQVCAFVVHEAIRYLVDSSSFGQQMQEHPDDYRWERSVWDVLRLGGLLIVRLGWVKEDPLGLPMIYFVLFDAQSLHVLGSLSASAY